MTTKTLQAINDRFVCHEDAGAVVCNRLEPRSWEQLTFRAEPDGAVLLETWQRRNLHWRDDASVAAEMATADPRARWWVASFPHGWSLIHNDEGSPRFLNARRDGSGLFVGSLGDDSWWRIHRGTGQVPTPRPPGPTPSVADPIIGALRYSVGGFADANGPRNVWGSHHGDLLGQAMHFGLESVLPALDAIAAANYPVVRSWFNVPPRVVFWQDKPVRHWHPADNPSVLRETLQAGIDRGIAWHLASGGVGTLDDRQENEMFDLVGDIIGEVGPDHIALFEVCNEIGGTGDSDDRDPRELNRIGRRIWDRYPQILRALSAVGSIEERDVIREYTTAEMQHYLYHPLRAGRIWDKIRHAFSMGYEAPVRRRGWAGEPWGNGRLVSVTGNKHELDAGAMCLGAAAAMIARQAWITMGYGSVVLWDDGRLDGPGFLELPQMAAALPRDLSDFHTLIHAGDRWRGTRIWAYRGEVRCDQAIHDDGRFVAVFYGPPEARPTDLRQERATRDVEILLDHPVGRVVTGRLA